MTTGKQPSPPEQPGSRALRELRAGCLPILAFALILIALGIGQLARLVAFVAGITLSNNAAIVITAAIVALPLAALISRSRPGRARAAYLLWSFTILFALFMIPLAWIAPVESQYLGLARLVLAALYLLLLARFLRGTQPPLPQPVLTNLSLAGGAGALLSLPWLVLGALGSPLDVLLDLAAGMLLGLAAALLIAYFPQRAIDFKPTGYWRDTLTGGLVISPALFFLAVNYAPHGASLLLIIVLPPLAWAVLALGRIRVRDQDPGGNWPAMALLVGLAAALPLLAGDPQTLSLEHLLFGRETIYYSLLAAGMTFALTPVLFLLIALPRRWWSVHVRARASLVWLGVLALWIATLFSYISMGKPGFYGDSLLVILKEQADVSAAEDIEDYDTRRRYVYDTLVGHAVEDQHNIRGMLDLLDVDYQPYYLVNSLAVSGGLPLRLLLASHPDVDRVLPNPLLRPLPQRPKAEPGTRIAPESSLWNLEMVDAPRVWDELGVRGEGIVIGQSDSGVQRDHPELAAGYRGAEPDGSIDNDYNWLDPWYADPLPTDDLGHGTHTLAIAVGQTVGVAPGAQWVACKNLARGVGNMAHYLDCLQFMLAPYPRDGNPWSDGDPTRAPHVLNNSWGCPADTEGCDAQALEPAIDALYAAGIFFVASAGNEGPECSTIADPPATYDNVFSVGALDSLGRVAGFSSTGPVTIDDSFRLKPDIVAPGNNIFSAFPLNSYFSASGTSMAGPHVAGVVALLWSANPALIGDIAATRAILTASAGPYQPELPAPGDTAALEDFLLTLGSSQICRDETDTSTLPNNVTGYGIVNAFRAVRMALESR